MIRVYPSQEEALTALARHDFHLRLCDYLREQFPEETAALDEPSLLRDVAAWEERAARYGGKTELAIAQWACLSLHLGFQPDEQADLREALQSGARSVEDLLDKVIGHLNYVIQNDVRLDVRLDGRLDA